MQGGLLVEHWPLGDCEGHPDRAGGLFDEIRGRVRVCVSALTLSDLESGAVRAFATDLSSDVTQELSMQPDRVQHFFEPFALGTMQIELRIDWTDIDANGNPTLDANLYDSATHRRVKSKRAKVAHHTLAKGSGERIFVWEFGDKVLPMRVTLKWAVSGRCTATATSTLTMAIHRAQVDAVPETHRTSTST